VTTTEEAEVLTIAEAAKVLRVARNTVYQATKRGDIPSIRVGRRILIPREALDRMLKPDA